jgi:hypothetical protein
MSRLLKLRRARPDLLALLGYVILTVLMSWPVAARLRTHLVGWGNDPFVHYWNNWWVGQALQRGTSPYYTDMLFHPNGASMVYHNFAWLNIAGGLALEPLLGSVGAYNMVFLVNIALCGFAMYHLACYVLRHRAAAFVAGLVHAFWPYRMHHTAHPNLISTQWMVWFLLYLIKTVREGKRRHILLAALFLTLTALARLQLLVMTLFPAAIYLLYSLAANRELWSWQTVGRLALIGALTGAALAYPLFPLVRQQLVGEHPGDVFIDEQTHDQSDLMAYVLPNPPHPLRQFYAPEILRTQIVFLGYTTLALTIYGVSRAKQTRLWLLIGIFSFVMALGPSLRLYGQVYPGIPLPYRLLGWSFPVRIMRSPHRFNILLAIPVALLTGFGIRAMSRSGRRARWVPVLAAGLILFEYLRVPLPTISLAYSSFYDRLAATSGRFGVLDLPMGFSGPAKFYMYLQTVHGKPIVQGKMARPERDINAFIDGDDFTKHLRVAKTIDRDLTAVSRHLGYLANADVRHLILHRDPQLENKRPSEERLAKWQDWLTFNPLYQDDRIAVYSTRPQYGRDFDFEIDLGAGIGVVEVGEVPTSLVQGNVLDLELRWGSRVAPGRDLQAELSLVDEAGLVRQSIKVEPIADWSTSDWPTGAIAIGRYALHIDPHLPPGQYVLRVALTDTGRPAILGHLNVESLPRTFEPPEHMAHILGAGFGDEIRLLGYDLGRDSDTLRLTLHWQATDEPEVSYKVFVHLSDSVTGTLVAQNDAVPRDWTYPTTWWKEGEVVSDEVQLCIGDVPKGTYHLTVGLYHPESGERLAVVDAEGRRQPQRQLVLQEVIVE